MVYYAIFEPAEEGGFIVTFPDLDRGVTQGDTEAEALEMAEDALVCMLDLYIRRGDPLPAPRTYRGKKYRAIHLPALVSIKAELYRAFQASGIRKSVLARRLGISKGIVDRLFDVKYRTRIDQLEAAFAAIGKAMVIEIRDVAA